MQQQRSVDVEVNPQAIKLALRNDPAFFISFFLHEQLTHPVPQFHKSVFNDMTHTDVSRLAIALPRAHAKTTLVKLAVVWHFLFSHYRFILYVSGSHDLVVPYVNDIANFFETDNFIEIFGQVKWIIRQEGNGLYKFYIPSLDKTCILRGLGSGQRIRGINVDNERPQLAVCDDLEDDTDVESEANHFKSLNWWAGPFIKCLNQFDNKIIMLGNLLSKMSVFYKMLHSSDWKSYIYGVIKQDGTPLWPDLWPIEAILKDYKEYEAIGLIGKWFAEMMNHPVAEGGGIIKAHEICFAPIRVPEEIEYGFITIDFANSKQNWADKTAIGAHGWVPQDKRWQSLEEYHKRGMDPSDIYYKAMEMAMRWGFKIIGCESSALQEVYQHHFRLLQLVNQHDRQIQFIPVRLQNRKKSERIITWASGLKNTKDKKPTWALTLGMMTAVQQLLDYEPMKDENDDDVIDMMANGLIVVQQSLHLVIQSLAENEDSFTQTLYDVADC